MASLSLEEISFAYLARSDRAPAIDQLSLRVKDGELLVVIGPSGSGKTTLLRLIAGLEQPSAGTIRIGNQMVNGVVPRKRNVAMVFQHFALYPHMTVIENLAFALRMRKAPGLQIDTAVRTISNRLGLGDLLHRKPSQLSGGERQRVALGRAIVLTPNLFLLDEPLSNLDLGLRSRSRSMIKEMIRKSAVTAVYVTHDQEEAVFLADRVAVLREGRLQQCAPPTEVFERPANLFVATFFGSPTMNLIAGALNVDGGRGVFQGGGLRLPDIKMAPEISRVAGQPVILGIRPHDVAIYPSEANLTPPGATLTRSGILSVEFLGNSNVVRVDSGAGTPIVANVSAHSHWTEGDAVQFSFPPDRLHFFDPATGDRLGEACRQPGSLTDFP